MGRQGWKGVRDGKVGVEGSKRWEGRGGRE